MMPINKRRIGICIFLSIITLGCYLYYWWYLLIKNTRAIKDDRTSCAGEFVCVLLVPYYTIYWWITRGRTVRAKFAEKGLPSAGNEILYAILALFGFQIVSMAIMQNDFNSVPPETDTEYDPQYILQVKDLKKYFPIKGGLVSKTVGHVKAVDGVTFNLKRGTTMGLVGESGCGKTTTGRMILRLSGEKTAGQVLFNGQDVYALSSKEMRRLRPKMQIIYQDPFSSLSPRLPVGEIISEAVREHRLVPKEEFEDYIDNIMENCGLRPFHKNRYPHEFSGGQRQRICIARALAMNPEFVVCDEPVSALDVSIQAQIINLLKELQEKYNLTYLFISHDLSVVEHISDTVGVMYLGNLVEYAETDKVFSNPLHPYTQALFSAIPVPDPDYQMNRVILEGNIPSPANPPSGCKFHTRCSHCMEMCKHFVPDWQEVEPGHFCACHLHNSPERNAELEALLNEAIEGIKPAE